MDYKKYLGRTEELVLPYFGGRAVSAKDRILRLSAPIEPGWWRFSLKGRAATGLERSEPALEAELPSVRGHLLGRRLVRDGAIAEPIWFLPEDEPPRFAPCRARRWWSGELVFDALDFESEAEEAVRRAAEEGGSLGEIKGVAATLRAAFGYALADRAGRALQIPVSPPEVRGRVLDIASGGRPAAEVEVRRIAEARRAHQLDLDRREQAAERRRAAEAAEEAGRAFRARAQRDEQEAVERAEDALVAAGAVMLDARRLGRTQLEVTYRFMGERFITIVDARTLQVLDAGICLAGADEMVTLESLPGVIREAIEGQRLVFMRGGEYGDY